jgi:threonine/homoserine/homoserine lactone efflux protein
MDTALILTFTGAGILLNITPGSDVAFSMASGISGGPRAGVAAATGITLGGLTHVFFAGRWHLRGTHGRTARL